MIVPRQVLAPAVFGIVAIGSGLARYLFEAGGEKGLVFGFVTGSLGLLAARVLHESKTRLGLTIAAIAMALVVGWFSWESFVIKGFADAEWRQLIVIVVTLVCALFTFRR